MKRLFTAALLVAMAVIGGQTAFSQIQRDKDFKDKYQLKEAVVLSRHNIRSPLSDSKSTLGQMTPTNGTNGARPRASSPTEAAHLRPLWDNTSANGR